MNLGNECIYNDLRVSVDWISFTFFSLSDVADVIEFFGYSREDFTELPRGGMGYKSILKLNGYNLQILYNGREDMGIHINISGTSIYEVLRSYANKHMISTVFGDAYDFDFDFDTVLTAFLSSVSQVANFTRIDIAVDDLGATFFSLDYIQDLLLNKISDKRIVTKFRSWQEIRKMSFSKDKSGHTIYFGSRQSDVFLRVYDKTLEQKITDFGITWIRWELEFKGDKVEQVARLLCSDDLGSVFSRILNNYMRIVVLDDSNVSRCSVSQEWQNFICTTDKLSLHVSSLDKTLEEKEEWFKRQVAPTLAGIIISRGGDSSILHDFFPDYVNKMSKEMINICDRHNPGWRNKDIIL